jgi:hypothetical protein
MTATLVSPRLTWTAFIICRAKYLFSLYNFTSDHSRYNFVRTNYGWGEIRKCLQEFKEEQQKIK